MYDHKKKYIVKLKINIYGNKDEFITGFIRA